MDRRLPRRTWPAGLGAVVVHDGQRIELSEYLGSSTNNIAELTAVLRAVELAPGDKPIVVHTDSQYAIGVLAPAGGADREIDAEQPSQRGGRQVFRRFGEQLRRRPERVEQGRDQRRTTAFGHREHQMSVHPGSVFGSGLR